MNSLNFGKHGGEGMFSGPMYKLIKRRMLEWLRAGKWLPGEPIPAEKKLAEEFEVSIGTLRKAVDELVTENILVRHQGRGTFVASHNKDRLLFYFFHMLRYDAAEKEYPQVELIFFEKTVANQEVAHKLQIELGAPIFRYINRLYLDQIPMLVDDIFVAEARFPGLSERIIRERESTIYRLYQEAYNVAVVGADERLRAILPDEEQAKWLGVTLQDPLLMVRRLAYTYQQQPVEWRRSVANTRLHEYAATINT